MGTATSTSQVIGVGRNVEIPVLVFQESATQPLSAPVSVALLEEFVPVASGFVAPSRVDISIALASSVSPDLLKLVVHHLEC